MAVDILTFSLNMAGISATASFAQLCRTQEYLTQPDTLNKGRLKLQVTGGAVAYERANCGFYQTW